MQSSIGTAQQAATARSTERTPLQREVVVEKEALTPRKRIEKLKKKDQQKPLTREERLQKKLEKLMKKGKLSPRLLRKLAKKGITVKGVKGADGVKGLLVGKKK